MSLIQFAVGPVLKDHQIMNETLEWFYNEIYVSL